MSRLIVVKLAVAAVVVCGLAGSASAQLSGLISGETKVAKADPERAPYESPDVAKSLPRLGADFKIVKPASKTYNAFSYVVGVTDRWINPEMGPAGQPFEKLDALFGEHGFRRASGIDMSLKSGVKKIAVYGKLKSDGEVEQVTAAALQGSDGTWSSKTGGLAVIGFERPEQLTGPAYGAIVAVYEKVEHRRPSPFAIR